MNDDNELVDDSTSMTDSYTNGSGTKPDEKGAAEAASIDAEVKALVVRETRAVNLLRVAVIAVLVIAAVTSSIVVYKSFTAKENVSYEEEFQALSTRLVEEYQHDIHQKLWITQNLVAEVAALIDAHEMTAPNITIPSLDKLVEAAVQLGPVDTVYWSPILFTDKDRADFGTYAKEQIDVESQVQFIAEGEDTETAEEDHEAPEVMEDDLIQAWGVPSVPVWQVVSASSGEVQPLLFDMMKNPIFKESLEAMMRIKGPVMSKTYILSTRDGDSEEKPLNADEDPSEDGDNDRRLDDSSEDDPSEDEGGDEGPERAVTLFFPVFDPKNAESIIGTISMEFRWGHYLSNNKLIDEDLVREENVFDTDEVDVVMANTCGQTYTVLVDKGAFELLGEGDLHNVNLESLARGTTFEEFDSIFASLGTNLETANPEMGHCRYRIIVYPTEELAGEHKTNEPYLFAGIVALIFFFTSSIFAFYDCIVTRRQRIITKRAMQTNAIVASLFPDAVRQRMIDNGGPGKSGKGPAISPGARKLKLASYLTEGKGPADSAAIADLFPSATVIFADVAGFTSWSSEREPSQVFKLLETIFADFDRIAKRLGVFKVETIGDCYMAVCGLPTPRDDHAVVATRFARIICLQMQTLCKDLESTLGPSTAELQVRIGLNSGPVTAGVLKGEKARFQLFGDTVNTASRMESTSLPSRVQITESTAEELRRFGFASWLTPREDTPDVKGKGSMLTYWVVMQTLSSSDKSAASSDCQNIGALADGVSSFNEKLVNDQLMSDKKQLSAKKQRLVNYNVDLLSQYLKAVVASRQNCKSNPSSTREKLANHKLHRDGQVLDDMVDVLTLPQFDSKVAKNLRTAGDVQLNTAVLSELRSYVSRIASLYKDEVPFHNWHHASHVVLSAVKLLNRIVTPEDVLLHDSQQLATETAKTEGSIFPKLSSGHQKKKKVEDYDRAVHEATYGISSDAMLQFALIFSAVIHDCDHQGVPNAQLSKEQSPVAARFEHRSVAEQNSVDLAWRILMEDEFNNLRTCIAASEEELKRFRQLVVVAIMSTDIACADLRKQRAEKWDKAFKQAAITGKEQETALTNAAKDVCGTITLADRRATAVLEQVLQASDVAHTMQHWHVYIKWNRKLFQEHYRNFVSGRGPDPSEGWYKGEIGFFDFYIIPLAKKLETCGVFGVSKDEYLKFASDNRKEWELKGRELVAQYRKECQEKFQNYSAKDQTAPVDSSQAISMEAETVRETNFDKCSWC